MSSSLTSSRRSLVGRRTGPQWLLVPLLALLIAGLLPAPVRAQFLASRHTALAQPERAVQQQQTLKRTLLELETAHRVHFVYEAALLEDVYVSRELPTSDDLEKQLTELLLPLKLAFKRINAHLYVIRPAEETLLPRLEHSPFYTPVATRKARTAFPIRAELHRPRAFVVSGQVVDDLGETLPGVSVVLKGTTVGTSTDIEGKYTLSLPSGNGTLVFSSVGFLPQEVAINNQTQISVTLETDTRSLDEVVVIGYGTSTKRELTGAVASVKPEEFNPGPVTDAMQLVQGKVAGLSVTRTNGGDPTGGFEVRLRGASSISADQAPLVVVDGIPGGNLATIAPEDIESIDILKDGSAAAIYGTRGTNGVILVTTKKGKKGSTQVDYSSRFFTESTLRKVEVLSADEYREIKRRYETTHPDVAASMTDYGQNTDWYDEITRTPFSHIQNLSLSGGAENTSYRMSFFYVDQEGVLLNSKNREYRVNLNLNQDALNDRLHFNVQLGLANYNRNPVDYNAVRQVIQRNPTEPVYNEDGSLTEYIGAWQYDNPVGVLTERTRDDGGTRIYGNLGANFDITKSLQVGVLGGIQANRQLNGYYQPSYSLPQETAGSSGQASRYAEVRNVQTLETTLRWDRQWTNHNLNMVAGYSFQEFTNEGFEAQNTNFLSDMLGYNDLGSGTWLQDGRASMSSFKDNSRLVGFFGRLAYNFQGKYFLSASIRREGSTKFGANNKWGTFPALSGAWDLTKEGFMSSLGRLSFLKLRAGYGVTGNQGLPPYLSLTRLGQGGYFFYQGQFIPSVQPISNPNPNLKWETKHEWNVGIDWALTGNRVSGTVDAYVRDTRDLLHEYDVPVPPNLFPTTWSNVGSLRNSGIEFTLNVTPVQKADFTWDIAFNADYRWNKLLSLSNEYYKLEYRNVGDIGSPGISAWTHQYREGAPLGIIHGLVYEGLDENGEWIFRDYNPRTGEADGIIDINDRADIGNGIPDFYAGLTNTFKYKQWDLSVMARGMFGHQIINAKRIWHENPKFLPRNIMKSAMDTPLWDDPEFSSYYVEDGDFVKIDNITLGYNFPFRNIAWLKNGRLYATVTNAFLFTGYSGVDPELAIGGLEPGHDNRFDYPSTRTYTLGFNVSF
ncbi:TonB-linked outer membrane protein, SusC/RagA family [Catalinimonas alkaloidigena]|uniref:TonB-linked outer membrane protein, SusC/RagA family n=1 Tax=Catalinimonas alkaloidigena TaxID=1075417 RepID=A0A1G9QHC4_9BACT|nr:TonB-dependent receptor [Catalinimonas alkaloidigena]SDM10161.1 TonB-linked outer membrane protein, SusC/RagA family [Catalinimonas alkaloidigena]